MLGEAAVEAEGVSTWAPVNGRELDWQTVDRALRTIAHRRAELDADEAHWLRQAEALRSGAHWAWCQYSITSSVCSAMHRAPPRTGCGLRVRSDRYHNSLPHLPVASCHSRPSES
jgi:hypothetical protein